MTEELFTMPELVDQYRVDVVDGSSWTRPVPKVDELSAVYFAACAKGALLVQHCPACGHWQHYARLMCTACGGTPAWRQVPGTGTVHTHTMVTRPTLPGFAGDEPYVIAMVELESGVMIMGNVIDCPQEDVHVGMAVQARVVKVSDSIGIPQWRPARGGDPAR